MAESTSDQSKHADMFKILHILNPDVAIATTKITEEEKFRFLLQTKLILNKIVCLRYHVML